MKQIPDRCHLTVMVLGVRSTDGVEEVHWFEHLSGASHNAFQYIHEGYDVCCLHLRFPTPVPAPDITTFLHADKSKWLPPKVEPMKPFVDVTIRGQHMPTRYNFDTQAECAAFIRGIRASSSDQTKLPSFKVWYTTE